MLDTKSVNIFVSCPGDVSTEKDMVGEVSASINRVLERSRSPIRFDIYDWREIIGELGDRPQEQINSRFSNYNIYIGILWMRFGAPTGGINPDTETEYDSGTEEEFRIALRKKEAGEKISIHFFFKEPKGPRGKEEILQYLKVSNFYDEVKSLGIINSIPNEHKSNKFNNDIHEILFEFAHKFENEILQSQKIEYLTALELEQPTFKDVARFINNAPIIEHAIPRSLIPYRPVKDFAQQYWDVQSNETLSDIVATLKRVVVLGSAGSGKSIELGLLAHAFAKLESPFVPVYVRLNTYVDDAIEDFLPVGWKEIPESNALIIMDGLDEVQPHNFNTAVRKILSFSDVYPELRIVLSCRTNFYDFPDKVPGGTLSGFDLYFMKDILGPTLYAYAQANYHINGEEFIKAAFYEGYSELTRQPFFLKLLLKEFQQNGNLQISRVSLMNKFIEERIAFDRAHFKLTANLGDRKLQIFSLLQRIALTMEYLGRNYLYYDELLKVVPIYDDVQLVKFSTAFKNIEADTEKWGFEHNNIQEFLAASALKDLNINEIQAFLSFNNKRVKPSWVNTLFFLMSIINSDKCKTLIQWILEIEPEILIKIEPDKIDPSTRFDIFKRVFEYYKTQGVWLRSNKFTERELALFAPVNQAYQYLITEFRQKNNSRTVKLNALTLLKHLTLNDNELDNAKIFIIDFIESNPTDKHIFNAAVSALVSLNIVDKELVKKIISEFGDRSNQYIRSGIYQLIIKAGVINEYIDYFIDGVSGDYKQGDRDNIHLLDEDLFLKEGLIKADSVGAVQKILQLFKNPFDRKLIYFYEKDEFVKKIISNAVALYPISNELENDVYNIYIEYGRASEEHLAEVIADFFKAINRQSETFKKILFDKAISAYEKGILLKPILSKTTIDFVVNQYLAHNLTNSEVLGFYNSMHWYRQKFKNDAILNYLTDQIIEKTSVLDNQNNVDHQKILKEREQENFNLLFSESAFRNEVVGFFKLIGKDELSGDDLWTYNPHDLRSEIYLKEPIFSYLSDFTRGNRNVKSNEALKWLEGPDFNMYLFWRIKENLTNHPNLTVSKEQRKHIDQWVQKTVTKTDITGAIKKRVNHPSSVTRDSATVAIWYFIKKFDFQIDKNKILDFTLFDEFKHNDEKGIDFTIIEAQAGREAVEKKVLINIKAGVLYDISWRNNANYALEHGIRDAFPIILKNLGDHRKSEYVRRKVLANYINKTQDYQGLMALLKNIGMDELQWAIVDSIKLASSVQTDLISYLEGILNNENGPGAQRIMASQYLTEKDVDSGTLFYLNHLLSQQNPAYDFYREAIYIRTMRDSKYIPQLMELLKMANRPEFMANDFNRFDGTVIDALNNIGLQSEENLQKVQLALNKFIDDNIGIIDHANFYYPIIDRMEYQFYLIQSQNGSIDDAIKEVEKINT
ncbi:NACHT domain-containing protein [Mucilaginibacter sp. McL0603]|uniref:NACHT domain-containing protein n=1 Tax=Mucilaginibacter sp. McL0603 TaxID=3415670 RepID=UPI003CE9BF41